MPYGTFRKEVNMENLLLLITAALTVVNDAACEARLVTNIIEIINYIAYGLCPSSGWIQLLVHIETGELVMLVDYGRYKREVWRLLLIGGYMPIPHFDVLDSCPHDGGGIDVVIFRDKYFRIWLEGKRALVRQILARARAFDADVYMPFTCLKQGDYLALGISESVRGKVTRLPKHYKHYLHGLPDKRGIVIAPPSLEMIVGFGFDLNPADWLIPDPDDLWVDRPEHHPISGVPFELCARYDAVVYKINSVRTSHPYKVVLSSIRECERMLIEFELDVLRGADEAVLHLELAKIQLLLLEI